MQTGFICKRNPPDVAVVGGGPAGMLAALTAARAGARVTLLERNEKLGKKLYITGKGRCNVTNTADFEDFFGQVPRNPRFLQAAIRGFSHVALRDVLQQLGVPTVEERGRRVFPASQKASDVTRGLARGLAEAGVDVRLSCRALALDAAYGAISGLRLENGEALAARAVILATGGASYPATGSTGDGYTLARAVGHTVHGPLPALVPLIARDVWPAALQGLSLRNVRLAARRGGRLIFDEQGELLFTHFGISGPLALALSSQAQGDGAQTGEGAQAALWGALDVRLDTKPGLTFEQLDARLLRDFEALARKQFANALAGLLPARMAATLPQICGIPAHKPVHQITRAERQALGALLKGIPLPIAGTRALEEAVITRGGVEVRQVDPSTMMSKRVPGLYFAGELLDVDAQTGGFNLQIAFSTGVLAGQAAAAQVRRDQCDQAN
ncbi:MAG: NAD(P)/FAD-dependent oxidoreductase [Oscillospiraceae bacterium]|jgi:predicted Rossmann fold flavoprotein|nr:NAD(P)/FAD-dependent oxidoreductase [Oscillospiraceae bacterium]